MRINSMCMCVCVNVVIKKWENIHWLKIIMQHNGNRFQMFSYKEVNLPWVFQEVNKRTTNQWKDQLNSSGAAQHPLIECDRMRFIFHHSSLYGPCTSSSLQCFSLVGGETFILPTAERTSSTMTLLLLGVDRQLSAAGRDNNLSVQKL